MVNNLAPAQAPAPQAAAQPTGALDPKIKNLSMAIRQVESGGDPTAVGKSGEYGAYQFTQGTWDQASKEAGVNVPLQQSTLAEQNEVAYKLLAKRQAEHPDWNIGNQAAAWNAGEGEADAYKGTFSNGQPATGTNKFGANYDVPGYAAKVAQQYQTFKGQNPTGQSAPNTDQSTPDTQQPPGLGDQLASRIKQVSQSLTDASTGKINWASGALQSFGAVAGGVGDITNAALELIPGVKQVEQGIGNAIGDLANTSEGQSVIQAGAQFAAAHPEIAGDIAAGANILSVVPMFKGLTLAKDSLTDAVSNAFQSKLEGAVTKELSAAAMKGAARAPLEAATARGLDPIKTIISERFLPDVGMNAEGNPVYQTENAFYAAKASVKNDEAQLQKILASVPEATAGTTVLPTGESVMTAGKTVSLDQIRKETLAQASKDLAGNPDYTRILGKINDDFDGIKSSLGGKDSVTLQDLNDIKRTVRDSLNWKSDSLDTNSRYLIGDQMMKKIESEANAQGIQGVKEINNKMASKLEAMKVLKKLSGKSIKLTKAGRISRIMGSDIAGGAGELLGNAAGLPFAGTLAGRQLGRLVGGRTPGTALRMLSRSGKGGIATGLAQGAGRIAAPGLFQGIRQ